MRARTIFVVMMTLVTLVAPVAGAAGAAGATSQPKQDAAQSVGDNKIVAQSSSPADLPGSFINATNSVKIWDRSPLTLRVDRSDTAPVDTSVKNLIVQLKNDEKKKTLRDAGSRNLVVYPDDATVDLTFDIDSNTDAGINSLDDENLILISAKTQSSDDTQIPSGLDIQSLENFVQNESDSKNVIFKNISSKTTKNGVFTHTYDLSEDNRGAGAYTFMVLNASGEGIDVSNGNISVPGEATVLGADSATVHDNPSKPTVADKADITADGKHLRGESIDVQVNPNLNTDDNRVEHAVVLYNESDVSDEVMTVVAPDKITNETTTSEFTINHTVANVNGVQDVDGDLSAFGRTVSDDRRTGVFALSDIVSFIADGGNFSEPTTNRVSPNTTIDASVTSVNASDAGTQTISVGTRSDFEPGEYTIVHMAIADGNLTKTSSSQATIEIVDSVDELDDGSSGSTPVGDDGGDGSDDGGDGSDDSGDTTTPPPETAPEPVTNVEGNAQAETSVSGQTVTVSISGAAAGDSVETAFDQATVDRNLDETGAAFNGLTKRFAASSDFSVDITYSRDNPNPNVPELEASNGAKAFGHINVEHGASDDALEGVTFRFSVRQDRLDEIGITAEDVSLYRYNDDEWEEYEATIDEEGDNRVTFTADSPGLSTFAIGQSTDSTGSGTDETDGTDDGTDSTDSTDGGDGGDGGDGEDGPPVAIAVILLVLAIAVAIGFGVYQSRQE